MLSLSFNPFSFFPLEASQTDFVSAAVPFQEDPFVTEIPNLMYSYKELPKSFAYPFCCSDPHPLSKWACNQLKEQIQRDPNINAQFDNGTKNEGKMFGILIVRSNDDQHLGYLKAFSGTLPNRKELDGFCPMVYNRFCENGFYEEEEEELNAMNRQIQEMENDPKRQERHLQLESLSRYASKTLRELKQQHKVNKQHRKDQRLANGKAPPENQDKILESRLLQEGAADQREFKALKVEFQERVAHAQGLVDEIEQRLNEYKAQRKMKSSHLQNKLFDQYQFLNYCGETASLLDIFAATPMLRPPSGAGDCAAPKLFQYAFSQGYVPIAMAEFWWGAASSASSLVEDEVRNHGHYYPACRSKCEPILSHMMRGMNVEEGDLGNRSKEGT